MVLWYRSAERRRMERVTQWVLLVLGVAMALAVLWPVPIGEPPTHP